MKLMLICAIFLLATADARGTADNIHYESPRLVALIVGISDYDSGKLPHAMNGARTIERLLGETYAGIEIKTLLNQDANLENIRRALREISDLPSQSLFVFYFAGHADRESPRGQLMLRLWDSAGSDDLTHAIPSDEIVGVLRYSRQLNAMFFIDSCFSGKRPRPMDLDEFEFGHIGHRAFLLASSASTAMSEKGLFTSALEEVFGSDEDPCLTPRELERRVRQIVWNKSKGYMVPQLAFDTVVTRCISQLGRPSCHLIFRYAYPMLYQCTFELESVPDELFLHQYHPTKDPVFSLQITAEAQTITVYCRGGQLARIELTEDMLADGIEIVDLDIPNDMRVSDDWAEHHLAAVYSHAMTLSLLESFDRSDRELLAEASAALQNLESIKPSKARQFSDPTPNVPPVAFGVAAKYVALADEDAIRALADEYPSALLALLPVLQHNRRFELALLLTGNIHPSIAANDSVNRFVLLYRGFAATALGQTATLNEVRQILGGIGGLEFMDKLQEHIEIAPDSAPELIPLSVRDSDPRYNREHSLKRNSLGSLNDYLNPRDWVPDPMRDSLEILQDAAQRSSDSWWWR